MEEYIICVVAAEIPADFEIETLKAQAVAARTYSVKKIDRTVTEHFGADVCTDFNHCQAFYSENDMKERWGKNFKKYLYSVKPDIPLLLII